MLAAGGAGRSVSGHASARTAPEVKIRAARKIAVPTPTEGEIRNSLAARMEQSLALGATRLFFPGRT